MAARFWRAAAGGEPAGKIRWDGAATSAPQRRNLYGQEAEKPKAPQGRERAHLDTTTRSLPSAQKRQRTAAVQKLRPFAPASWTAAVLCRFLMEVGSGCGRANTLKREHQRGSESPDAAEKNFHPACPAIGHKNKNGTVRRHHEPICPCFQRGTWAAQSVACWSHHSQRRAAATKVAQTSKSAVSRVSKPAERTTSHAQPIGKSAIRQVWKPALRPSVTSPENLRELRKL